MQTLSHWCFNILWQNFDGPWDREIRRCGLAEERASLQAAMLRGWWVCPWQGGGFGVAKASPRTQPPQAPHFLLSFCPCVFAGYTERGEPIDEEVCKEAVGHNVLRLGLPTPTSRRWCHLLAALASHLCLHTLDVLLLLTWWWALNRNLERTKEDSGKSGTGKKKYCSADLFGPKSSSWTADGFKFGMVLRASQAAPSPGREAGCCSRSCPWGVRSRVCPITSSFDLPSLLVMGLVSQAGGDGRVGRMVPTQLSLLSCGTQTSLFQGWPCSQKHYKIHMPPQFCMKNLSVVKLALQNTLQ